MTSTATSNTPQGDEPPLPPPSDSAQNVSQKAATIRGPSSSTSSSSSSYSSTPSSSRSLSRAFLEMVLRPPAPASSHATPRSSTPSPSTAAAAAGSSVVLPQLNSSFALGAPAAGGPANTSTMRLQRSSSSVSTQSLSYKPQRPSSLASEATTGGGDDDDEDEDHDEDADDTAELAEARAKADSQTNGGPDSAKSAASASGASEAGSELGSANEKAGDAPPFAPSSLGTTASSSAGSATSFGALATGRRPSTTPSLAISSAAVQEVIGRILTLLKSEDEMEEDERIEGIRKEIGDTLRGLEGKEVAPSRLDNLVLDLLHRHHEDQQTLASSTSSISTALPAGGPASPYLSPSLLHRRPSSVRSSSSISARPWTPSRPSFEAIAVPATAASNASSSGSSSSHVPPGIDTLASSLASAAIGASSPFAASPLSASLGSNTGPIIPPSSPAQYGLGAIGSGSPRASPRLWNRTASSSSVGSGGAVNWSSLTSSMSTAKGTPGPPSSTGADPPTSPPSAPSAGSGPSSLLLAATTGQGTSSRPASPSPLGSPRLNIAASEFKPRTSSIGSVAHGGPSNLARTSSFLAASAKSGLGRSSRSAAQDGSDDSEENDEFSPFASSSRQRLGGAMGMSHLAAARPDSDLGSWNGSAASQTSSSGGYDPSPLSSGITRLSGGDGSSYDDAPVGGEDGSFLGGAFNMTPFDVLQSIVNAPSTRAGPQQPKWTTEQLEEALAQNGWDVDATLASIAEGGGLPPSSRPPVAPTGPAGRGTAPSGPRGGTTSNPSSPAMAPRYPRSFAAASGGGGQGAGQGITDAGPGRAGISIMSKEAFQSYRNAAAAGGGGVVGASTTGTRFGSPRAVPAGPSGHGAGGTGHSPVANPGATAAAAAMAQGGGPGAGPGRVCRYFLAGECRRADCRFSHDLGRALCRFWLRGQCLNNPCSFLHDYEVVNALASGITSSSTPGASGSASSQSAVEPDTPPNEDFPELHAAPLGPKAQRKTAVATPTPPTGPADPSRTRWAAALQRKATGPMALVQQGEANIVSVHARGAPMRPIPSGPRATSGGAPASAAGESGKASSRLPLRPPSLLPTLSTGRGASAAYTSHRSAALNLSEERNRCFARAADAWKSGDGATARQWSARGQALNGQMADESRKAAAAIVKQRNAELREKLMGGGPGSAEGALSDEAGARGMRGKAAGAGWGICLGVPSSRAVAASSSHHSGGPQHSLSVEERAECFLDLHGLHSDEAVEIVEAFLVGLEKEAMRGLAFLGIGKASHSSTSTDRRRVKLSPAVRHFLASWGYPFQEMEGIIVVDPLTHY